MPKLFAILQLVSAPLKLIVAYMHVSQTFAFLSRKMEFRTKYTILLMQIFVLPSSLWRQKICKIGELIRQNVTKQSYFAPERPETGNNLYE